ncbi:proline--tRNA ligase [Candidatus Woesearchaeota archaeon]|nr:proline--tRNA ligase [Candidatus Woesearchaeota archaeon]
MDKDIKSQTKYVKEKDDLSKKAGVKQENTPVVNTKGITVSKEEDYAEWFTQLIQKAELIEYSSVSGCYILRPNAYFIWEEVQTFFDGLIKKEGVKNAYFPLFIPESLLFKESKHVEGFAPEVAWVDYGGDTKLGERLAVRPTSETIMYEAYAKWIRSYNDLPLRLNQWCNVVRWEFKHCTPLLRSREFLWQEGHTVFATQEEAVAETHMILDFYEKVFREMYAVPVLKGRKSEQEKFAGADFTLSVEALLPNGKAIQGATSHHLGQNFSKVFGISFLDEEQRKRFAWQNSWGISTRSIGIMILMHSDNKGLVLPPRVAPIHVVIVPILFEDTRWKVLEEVKIIKKKLEAKGIRVYVDDRDKYTPGWKFNEWEMKGVPLRFEIGPKDVEKKQVMFVRRDTGEKQGLPLVGAAEEAELVLEQIQRNLLEKAQKRLGSSIEKVTVIDKAAVAAGKGKLILAPWCEQAGCEESIKERIGVKSLNAPFEQQPNLKKGHKCFACDGEAKAWFYFGKSY